MTNSVDHVQMVQEPWRARLRALKAFFFKKRTNEIFSTRGVPGHPPIIEIEMQKMMIFCIKKAESRREGILMAIIPRSRSLSIK